MLNVPTLPTPPTPSTVIAALVNTPAGAVAVMLVVLVRVYVTAVPPICTPPLGGTPMNPSPVMVICDPPLAVIEFDPCGGSHVHSAMQRSVPPEVHNWYAVPESALNSPPT